MNDETIIGKDEGMFKEAIERLQNRAQNESKKDWTIICDDYAIVYFSTIDMYDYVICQKDEMYFKIFKRERITSKIVDSVIVDNNYLFEFFYGIECASQKGHFLKSKKVEGITGWHDSIKEVFEPIFRYFIDDRWYFQSKNYKPLVSFIYGGKTIATLIIPTKNNTILLVNNGEYSNIYVQNMKIDRGELIGKISNDFDVIRAFIEGLVL